MPPDRMTKVVPIAAVMMKALSARMSPRTSVVEKVIVEEAADEKQRDEHGDRRKKRKILLVHRFVLAKALYSATRRLVDCRSSTMMTTIALTTRLYSGGRPLVRIEVVSAWMTSTPSSVMPR